MSLFDISVPSYFVLRTILVGIRLYCSLSVRRCVRTSVCPYVRMSVCPDENPKLVCGSVLTVKGQDGDGPSDGASGDLIVLGRRNIQPRRGFWGIPAGTYFLTKYRITVHHVTPHCRL